MTFSADLGLAYPELILAHRRHGAAGRGRLRAEGRAARRLGRRAGAGRRRASRPPPARSAAASPAA